MPRDENEEGNDSEVEGKRTFPKRSKPEEGPALPSLPPRPISARNILKPGNAVGEKKIPPAPNPHGPRHRKGI